jgi:agmatine/peptidylarginine deiminase
MSKGYPKNYRLPAEFEPQEAIWLSWPSNKESCPKTFHKLQDKFGEIAANLTRYERVRINAPEMMHMGIRLSIADTEGALNMVDLYNHPTNDVWCRDHGPIFIKHNETGKVAITDWKFDAWGGKFPHDLDNTIPEKAANMLKMDRYTSDFVLEGGAIETNGKGLLLTTEEGTEGHARRHRHRLVQEGHRGRRHRRSHRRSRPLRPRGRRHLHGRDQGERPELQGPEADPRAARRRAHGRRFQARDHRDRDAQRH